MLPLPLPGNRRSEISTVFPAVLLYSTRPNPNLSYHRLLLSLKRGMAGHHGHGRAQAVNGSTGDTAGVPGPLTAGV